MAKLRYDTQELMRSHDCSTDHTILGRRLHGGFDAAGVYLPPRLLGRGPAVEAWTTALRSRGGAPLLVDPTIGVGLSFPNAEHLRLLIREGLGHLFRNLFTTIAGVESAGRVLVEGVIPNFGRVVVEDISRMCLGHLEPMLRAHGMDEAGDPGSELGGHDTMWLVARDLVFPPSGVSEPPPEPGAAVRFDFEGAPIEIDEEFGRFVRFLQSLLLSELQGEDTFAVTQDVLRDPELFPDRRAEAQCAADLIGRIRADEQIHVCSLRLVIGEIRQLTFRKQNGAPVSGSVLVDEFWKSICNWSTVSRPLEVAKQQRDTIYEAIAALPEATRVRAEFETIRERPER